MRKLCRCRNAMRLLLVVGIVCLPWRALAQPDTGLYLNIQPPGQSGFLTAFDALQFFSDGTLPPHVDDQREMYANLVFAAPGLTEADLASYFKPAPLGKPPFTSEFLQPPFKGVTITRDEFGVPHIKGKTRRALFYGIGRASAEDRLFSMDIARHAGRGRLSEFLGPDPFALEQDEAFYQFAGYSEAELQAQLDNLVARFRGRGRRVKKDMEAFVAGVNAFIVRVNQQPFGRAPAEYIGLDKLPVELFTLTDVVAVAVQFDEIFGSGGGREHRNALLLEKLQAALGVSDGTALFRDLREAEEPEAPVTTELEFPYLKPGTVNPQAVALPELGSIVQNPLVQVTGPLPPLTASVDLSSLRRSPGSPSMSNFVAVTAENAAGGHPIAVMGPQTGYFVPELLIELNIEGRRFKARGMAATGAPYVVLGRGRNYAWSATAGGSDNTDVRAELLCEPDGSPATVSSTSYLFRGECKAMLQRTDTWCSGDTAFCAANPPNVTATVQRTVHGIVFARASVDGKPVALVRQRASFMREGESAVAFMRINRKTQTPRAFERAIRFVPGSFNWIYVNRDDLSYFHSGLYPLRAEGVDVNLPSWGTGEWEWQGLLRRRDHPSDLNPARGFLTSWNNKPARQWRAADSNYSYGSVYRVDSLNERVEAAVLSGTPVTVGKMVELMEDAATVDLRGAQVLPIALTLIGSEPALDPVLTVLQSWVGSGAFRRDRDDDGEYDHSSAVAIMDEWFERMIDAVFGAQIGPFFSDIPLGFDNKPGPIGSAYQSGYYGYLDKALRMAAGAAVAEPYEVLRCADGTAAGCRAALLASLSDAVAALTARFGSADPADWRADPTVDQIEFMPFGVAEVAPMPWVNRSTFQQVVQVRSRRPE